MSQDYSTSVIRFIAARILQPAGWFFLLGFPLCCLNGFVNHGDHSSAMSFVISINAIMGSVLMLFGYIYEEDNWYVWLTHFFASFVLGGWSFYQFEQSLSSASELVLLSVFIQGFAWASLFFKRSFQLLRFHGTVFRIHDFFFQEEDVQIRPAYAFCALLVVAFFTVFAILIDQRNEQSCSVFFNHMAYVNLIFFAFQLLLNVYVVNTEKRKIYFAYVTLSFSIVLLVLTAIVLDRLLAGCAQDTSLAIFTFAVQICILSAIVCQCFLMLEKNISDFISNINITFFKTNK